MTESALRIISVEAWPVRVERLEQFRPRTSKGAPTHSEYVVVRLGTLGGASGLGEVTCSPLWNGEDAVGAADLLERRIAPDLIGLHADDWPSVAALADSTFRGRPFLRAAIEMACLDAEGVTRGLPVAELLGGTLRKDFDTKFVLPARAPDLVAGIADAAIRLGAHALKVKVGMDLDEDARRLRAVRSVCADRPLMVDANEGWRADDPLALTAVLEPFDLVAVEQPFDRRCVEETAALRAALGVEMVGDESVWDESDLRDIGLSGAFSTVALYPGKVGGLRRCRRLSDLAHDKGLAVTFGSNLELGIGAAAMAHVMASTVGLSDIVASDLIGPLYFESSLVRDDGFVRFDGASLPRGPGLGVELDHAALTRHRFGRG